MATAKTTKKTKKSTEKTAKAKKVGRPRTKKPVVENVDAVVEEFLNDTAVETVFVKTEPTVESITTDATLQNDGTIVSGSLSKEQIDDLVESGVCVDTGGDTEVVDKFVKEIGDEVNKQVRDVLDESEKDKAKSPEEEITEIIYNQIAYEEDKEALDAILKENNEEESAPNVEEIINEEAQKAEETKPQYGPIKKKKRLTNRDVFGYDFMGVIYEY